MKQESRRLHSRVIRYYLRNRAFKQYYRMAFRNEFIDRDTFDKIQLERLKETLIYSSLYVPYYRSLFNKIGFKPSQFYKFEQLNDIPILEKSTVQQYLDDFISTAIPKIKTTTIYSGGSTGVPAEYKSHIIDSSIERAFMFLQWSRVGFNHKKHQRIVRLRGIKPNSGHYEIKNSDLILSSYIADNNMFGEYLPVIESFDPDFIHAYPSIIYLWAKFILKSKIALDLPKLKAIFLGSENLYDYQRQAIEQAFKVRVYSWYGHTERGCLAGECEISNDLHIFPDYGYAEVEGDYNDYGKKEGKLIVTSFLNKVMPLIRFNTEDIVQMSDSICSCGREHRLITRVNGRTNEYLLDYQGRVIPANVLLPYELIGLFSEVIQYQFIQEFAGETTFLMKVTSSFNDNHLSLIRSELAKELGGNMKLSIKIVEDIPRTARGKLSFLDTSKRIATQNPFFNT